MRTFLTVLCAIPLLLISLASMFLAVSPDNSESISYSIEKKKSVLADFEMVGKFTERFRSEQGRLPSEEEMLDWMAQQEFVSPLTYNLVGSRRSSNMWIVTGSESCKVGEAPLLDLSQMGSYRICHWDNMDNEYSPETGAHTLSFNPRDYQTPVWIRLVFMLIAFASAYLVLKLLNLQSNLKLGKSSS